MQELIIILKSGSIKGNSQKTSLKSAFKECEVLRGSSGVFEVLRGSSGVLRFSEDLMGSSRFSERLMGSLKVSRGL